MKAGDGVVFDAGRPDENEEGGRVHEITAHLADRSRRIRTQLDPLRPRGRYLARVHPGDGFGKPATPNWTSGCAKVFPAKHPNFAALLRWKFMAGPEYC